MDDLRESMGRRRFVVDLGGNGEVRIGLDGHGQFTQVAVVENAAAWSYFKGVLLLLLRFFYELLVAGDLEPEEFGADERSPDQHSQTDNPVAQPEERLRCLCASIAVGAGIEIELVHAGYPEKR